MDNNLKQIQQLLILFADREKSRNEYNQQIVKVLASTTLSAVVELIGVPHNDIMWVDIDVVDSILLVVCQVTYDPSAELSPTLRQLVGPEFGEAPASNVRIERIFHFGLPLAVVFSSKEDIIDFLHKATASSKIEDVNKIDTSRSEVDSQYTTFDRKLLTKEQAQQLLYFQHVTKGTKQ